MDYGKIVSTGWAQAWKHKTLWIFGFLISGGGGGNIFNYSDEFDNFGLGPMGRGDLYHIKQFLVEHLYIIVLLGLLAVLVFLIWIVLKFFG